MRRFLGILSIGVLSLAVIASDAAAEDYRLPWSPGLQVELTQDCNDSSYADHIGSGKNAWDFASGTHFAVLAARGGIVRHLKISSHSGCESAACVDLANSTCTGGRESGIRGFCGYIPGLGGIGGGGGGVFSP